MNTTIIVITLAALVIGVVLYRLFSPAYDKLIKIALEEKGTSGALKGISELNENVQAEAFNHLIRALWNMYERELAILFIRELAKMHCGTKISQYWINQAMSVEPDMAKLQMDKDFLDTYFKPEVAAQCGSVG